MRKRSIRREITLNEKEDKKLQSLMQKSGLTACQLLRKFILETEIRPRPPDEYAQLLRELSAIGNNINQIAYKANGLGEIYIDEVRAMREAFEKLYKEVKR